ncbi:MAG: hypothetical protein U5R06_09510 [candidate division KSB1 bacterium]|nr:hypothetical protein [candidate division KSB1 bacterium]
MKIYKLYILLLCVLVGKFGCNEQPVNNGAPALLSLTVRNADQDPVVHARAQTSGQSALSDSTGRIDMHWRPGGRFFI